MALAFFLLAMAAGLGCRADVVPAGALFQQGARAYDNGDFEQAALCFRSAAAAAPAPGVWHNLGNAQWQAGHPGEAILAWERGHWLDPFDASTRENLRFARKSRQLDPPEFAWYEKSSTWLPANAWAWIASVSFWLAVSLLLLPGVLRWRRAEWHQGVAAAGFAIFLLTLPELLGVHTRARLGVVLPESTPLRLTPTEEAQVLGKLPPGETVRLEREHGKYVYVRLDSGAGWVERTALGLIADNQ
jgi:tetratricopeptide (TPR) repeat protein